MTKKSCPNLYIKSLYKNGQDLLDILMNTHSSNLTPSRRSTSDCLASACRLYPHGPHDLVVLAPGQMPATCLKEVGFITYLCEGERDTDE